MKERFLVTDYAPEGFIEALGQLGFEVDYVPVLDNQYLSGIVHQYHGIVISTQISLFSEMLARATSLKYILRPGSGLDNIDVDYANSMGIWLFNSPEANSVAVGEHAMALLLSLLNYIPRAYSQVQRHQWIRTPNTGIQLLGKTVGVIGHGHTGSAFAARLSGFQVKTLVYDKYNEVRGGPHITATSLEQIKEEADILGVHVPLSPETKHMVSEPFIASFKKPFYLINTSRGSTVDTKCLPKALRSGKLLGLALDVLENENLATYTEEEKNWLDELMNAGNVIITPHIAGWTETARRNIFFMALAKFEQALQEKSNEKLRAY